MEVSTLTELLKQQQESILALRITLDSLIEELDEVEAIDFERLEKKVQKRIKKLTAIAKKEQEGNIPMTHFGPVGEA